MGQAAKIYRSTRRQFLWQKLSLKFRNIPGSLGDTVVLGFFVDVECIAHSPKIERIERLEPVAVSLLMAGEEDVEFWQKLSKNTKSNTDNKTYKTSGCHNYP